MSLRSLIGSVLVVLAASAQAQSATSILLQTAGRSDVPILGACGVLQSNAFESPSQASYEQALIGSGASASLRPIASVTAHISDQVSCPSFALAELSYSVQIKAAPNSWVPIDFSGSLLVQAPRFEVGAVAQGITSHIGASSTFAVADSLGTGLSLRAQFAASRFDSSSGAGGDRSSRAQVRTNF